MNNTLSDIYLVAGAIGFLYVVGTSVMGLIDSGDAGTADGGDASSIDASGDAGGDAGGGDASGDAGGIDAGADAGGDAGGIDTGGDAGGIDTSVAHTTAQFRAGMLVKSRSRQVNLTLLFLKIISPSTLTMFAFFFGLTGFILLHYLPAAGTLSLIPACVGGWLGYTLVSKITSSITSRMHVTTSFRETDLIGTTAEVTVPITKTGTGEITYVAHRVRTTAPARLAADNGQIFRTSSKVIISDIRDGIVYVEECPEELRQM